MFAITEVDNSHFSEEEKYIDSSSIDHLAKEILQDIERSKDYKTSSKNQGDRMSILLYIPEDRSYQQVIEGLKNSAKQLKQVSFMYYGKVCTPDMYGYFTGEEEADGQAVRRMNTNAKVVVGAGD